VSIPRILSSLSLVLLVVGCGAVDDAAESQAPPAGPSQARFPITDAEGRWIGSIPFESVRLDRVSWQPLRRGAVAVVHHGREGGSSLFQVDGNAPQLLLRTRQGESISTPVPAPNDRGFAYVIERAPRWTGTKGRSALQFGGEVWHQDERGRAQRISAVDDAARVLGWLDPTTLVITRYRPGDLPEQRPFRIHVDSGHVDPIAPAVDEPHAYSFEMSGSQLLYATSDAPVSTLPSSDMELAVVSVDLLNEHRVVHAVERGVLPSSFALDADGRRLSYVAEGTQERRSIDLDSGHMTIVDDRRVVHPAPDNPLPFSGLLMPYVHQVYDTPNEFNGHWACGPTSTLMAILHFGRLDPWPVTVDIPTPHESPFGAYIARTYTAYGTTFDRMQTDASGSAAHGAYGWCTEEGAAWAWRMQDYAEKHELATEFDDAATFAELEAATAAGKVVALSTNLTSAGHIITVKGTTAAGELIVNDPYGDRNAGYMNYEGEDVTYTFAEVIPKWFITVYANGPTYAATLVESEFPSAMVGGESATVTLTYRNDGTMPWDGSTMLGTTEPRDRDSVFYTSGQWVEVHRPAAVSESVYPGSETTISFALTAPEVCESTTYLESFNLVQEGVVWFSDEGGPDDDALTMSIEVTPIPGACEDAGAAGAGGEGGDGGSGGSGGSDSGGSDSGGSTAEGGAGAAGGSAVPSTTYKSEEADGCACRAGAGRTPSTWGWLVAIAVGWMGRRRRRGISP
jgi:uncharacterized membrane protein YgcG